MQIPKFLSGDNTDHPEDIFIIHTEYPIFIVNLANDDIEILEEVEDADTPEFREELENLVVAANAFYDREISRYIE